MVEYSRIARAHVERHLGAVRELTSPELVVTGALPVSVPERRVLLVGEDNPQSSHPEHALYDQPDGVAGHRLREKVLGIDGERYLGLWRVNLCCPTWDPTAARNRAEVLCGANQGELSAHLDATPDLPWRVIVLLGSKVASSFRRVLKLEYDFKPFTRSTWFAGQVTFVCLPHPSGRCRAWNDPESYYRARSLLAGLEPRIPWGAMS